MKIPHYIFAWLIVAATPDYCNFIPFLVVYIQPYSIFWMAGVG